MGKFDGVLLVSDYDDTLYPSSLTISKATHAALADFRQKGGRFTVATGRAYPTFTPQLEKEHLTLDAPAVLSNGAVVYDYATGRYLRQTTLPPEALADMDEVARTFPDIGLEFYHNEDIYILHHNAHTATHMVRVGTPFQLVDDVADIPTPYVKLIIEGEHEALLPAQALILEKWSNRYEAIFSNVHLLEITAKGSTKGGMVAWLADFLGIQRKNLYCIGDSPNDLSMLEVSAVPFAPANCTPDLKAFGAHILPHCDDDPIPALIADLEKRY